MAKGIQGRKMETEPFAFSGGLDLVTPALEIPTGYCISAQNYEPSINGGYRRMYGYERYNGMTQPHNGVYWNMACNLTGGLAVGNTVTGATSGATAVILQINGTTELIVTALTGTFVAENIKISGSVVGSVSSTLQSAGQTPMLHAQYLSLSANYYRNLISPVTGSNPIRGVWYYKGSVYAFRDNVGATACNMFRASSGGSAVVTATIATPCVISWASHGFPMGQQITFTTTGALPTGLSVGTTYYVINPTANTFQLSTSLGGSAVATSGTQSGVHTASATAGWNQVSFGREILFGQYQGTVTISIASPAVITWTAHGLSNGTPVYLSSSGALPTGLAIGLTYYVINVTANTFQLATTVGGSAINSSGTQSGTQLCTVVAQAITAGTTVTGMTSGASAVVQRTLLRTGTWSSVPVGSLVFDSVTGAFTSGEALMVGGVPQVASTTADTAIKLSAGGRCVFANSSFSGNLANFNMYFVDGVNYLQEFDGYRLVPIRTGTLTDTPNQMAIWENMVVVSISSSIQVSGLGNPYAWTALLGSAELDIGDLCTGMLLRPSSQQGGALAIFTGSSISANWNTFILYGTSSANFILVPMNPNAGASPYTAQNIGDGYSLDSKGIVKMEQTQQYGNFEMSTVSRQIQPIIDSKRGMATATCVIRSTDQYRIFFNDGTGIILYIKAKQTATMNGDTLTTDSADLMPFDYSQSAGIYFNTVESVMDASGIERVFAGGSNGYVYELERGSSHDGTAINAFILMAFNSSKSPRNRKKYHRSVLQAVVQLTAQVSIGYDLNYGSGVDQGFRTSSALTQTGGIWDQNNWDSATWDGAYLNDYVIDTCGNGLNSALLIYSNNAIDYPHTIQSMISHYSVGRLER